MSARRSRSFRPREGHDARAAAVGKRVTRGAGEPKEAGVAKGRRVLGVIPARIASQRLPRKPLARIAGRPLVQWVYEAASRASGLDELVVATDSEEVAEVAESFGAVAVMTRADHPSGTDRVAEVARGRDWAQVIVNIQGDEPLLPASYIDAGIAAFAHPAVRMATLVTPVRDASELGDPGVAKVVADRAGNALYFSRAPIPFVRGEAAVRLRHVGIYFFERAALFEFVGWPPSPLERAEGLEQLRALENGLAVRLVHVPEATLHVDTIEDLERVERIVSQHQGR